MNVRVPVRDGLDWLRARESLAVASGVTVGLLVSFVHYGGLPLGGALVGLPARSLRRALLFGIGFGVLVWLLFAGWLAAEGALGAFAGMGRLALLNVAASLGLPVLGALAARGLT